MVATAVLPLAVTSGAFLGLLAADVTWLVALLVAALVLFTRWLETADRSAYVVGTLCAIVAPAWLLVVLALAVWDGRALFVLPPSDQGVVWLADLAFLGAGLVLYLVAIVVLLRPLWVTGLFLKASQNTVRRRWKTIEGSWQFGIAIMVAAAVLQLLARMLDHVL